MEASPDADDDQSTTSDAAVAAARYCETSVPHQTPDGMKLIERVTVATGSKVLDLGCGTGAHAKVLAELVGPTGKVVGIDPDSERIKLARENHISLNVPQLQFLDGDGEKFPEDQYDLVFSNAVLHWIENKAAVFQKVYENIRPGGQFAFTVGEELPALQVEMTHLMGPDRAKKVLGKFHFVPMHQYEDMAAAVGFQLVLAEVEQRRYTLANIDAAFDSWFATMQGDFDPALIDQATLERFKHNYRDKPIDIMLPLHFFVFAKTS